MKVLLIAKGISGATPGDFRYSGVFRDTFELALYLTKEKVNVAILTPKVYPSHIERFEKEFGELFKKYRIEHYRANTYMSFGKNWGEFRLKMFWSEITTIRKIKPDIVQYMQFGPSLIYPFVGRTPVIFYSCYLLDHYRYELKDWNAKSDSWGGSHHNLKSIFNNILFAAFAEAFGSKTLEGILKKKGVLIFMHPKGYSLALKKFRNRNNIAFIPKGVNLIESEKWHARKVKKGTAPKVLFIGEILYGKGIFDLIEAFDRIKRKGIKAQLVIAGTGPKPLVLKLKKDIVKKGINAIYLGSVDFNSKWKLYYQSDIFCLPSYLDAYPAVILEAIACGLPVITTHEIDSPIIQGKSGIKVHAGDIDALAKSIVRLITDQKTKEKLALQSRYLAQKYSWEQGAKKFNNLYQRLKLE